ncbi:uncharacterized protein TRIADDRAFT_58210 [Trichoplax adhaerens]|uniref:MARVEL domain-containing protein n=1 Tax=Trichoplax adhaerens TaxID=10228 RepID=B3S162_TRIAD|nr:predicted protein [Trichoplax adhaerens]EDV23511.1 predicted protein [Trichoplax adhaerens]|eukprot:XP_002114421.1 predicted protein [Trichoplax adhaerens]
MAENENEQQPPTKGLPSFQKVSRMCLVLTLAGIALLALGLGEHITGDGTKVPITTDLHYHLFWAGGFILITGFTGMKTLKDETLPPAWMFIVVFILNVVTAILSVTGMILCIVGLATIKHDEPVVAYVMDSIEIVIYLIALGLTALLFRIAYLRYGYQGQCTIFYNDAHWQ